VTRDPQTTLLLTRACADDLDEIVEIEGLSFPRPWSRQAFVEELRREISTIAVLRQKETGRLVAYINFWTVHDEVHVLNLATHPECRRRGLARRLIEHAVEIGLARGAREVTLEVRRSNEAAIALYKRSGFSVVGLRTRYYENGEDAILMALKLVG
jgi:ribosomal-protein-alanine N-acetyltransferase